MRFVLTLLALTACTGEISGYVATEGATSPSTEPACVLVSDTVSVPVARLTARRFDGVLDDLFPGVHADGFPRAGRGAPFSTTAAFTRVSEVEAEPLLDAALAASMQIVDRVPPCAGDEAICARSWLTTTGRKALRREPSAAELSAWLTLFVDARASGMSYAEAVSAAMMAMLQSPAFLYALEPLPDIGSRTLSAEEARTRLALTFSNGLPDESLSNLTLVEAAPLRTEAARLVDTARGRSALRGFLREWLGLDGFHSTVHDAALQAALEEELERLFADALEADDGFARLMTSNETWVNSVLQRFYGLEVTSSGPDDWTRVALPSEQRAGVLTHPLLMARLAHGTEPSLVFRGLFVRRALLCEEVAPPPGDPFQLQASVGSGDGSVVSQSNIRLSAPACSGCHLQIDPIGAGFSAFDGAGHFDSAVQPKGELITANTELAGPFAGPSELGFRLAASPRARACFARQWLRYVSGKTETSRETCAIERSSQSLATESSRLPVQFAASAALSWFFTRTAETQP